MRKRTLLLLAVGAAGLAAIAVLRRSLETKLLFPGSATQGRADSVIEPGGGFELVTLRSRDGTRLVAVFGAAIGRGGRPAANAAAAPTVLFFYGNGSCAEQMVEEFIRFRQMGANCMIPDYPGYGMSGGRPSEEGFYEAADAAYDYLMQRPGINPDRIAVAGWSMGAAVAIDLASRRKVLALETISAFTTLPQVAHTVTPWLPVSLVLRSKFDNLSKIRGITCPVVIVHGALDRVVPPEMAGQLAAAAQGVATLHMITGAGHNDVFTVGGDALWRDLREPLFPRPLR